MSPVLPPKKKNDIENDLSCMSSFIILISLIYYHTSSSIGNREENLHRKRRDIEEDISLPLGDVSFSCSYRMKKSSFHELHCVLKDKHDSFIQMNMSTNLVLELAKNSNLLFYFVS
jgi:hypothetical protein